MLSVTISTSIIHCQITAQTLRIFHYQTFPASSSVLSHKQVCSQQLKLACRRHVRSKPAHPRDAACACFATQTQRALLQRVFEASGRDAWLYEPQRTVDAVTRRGARRQITHVVLHASSPTSATSVPWVPPWNKPVYGRNTVFPRKGLYHKPVLRARERTNPYTENDQAPTGSRSQVAPAAQPLARETLRPYHITVTRSAYRGQRQSERGFPGRRMF